MLTALYGWYRETAPMQRRVLGERATVPELDAWLARSTDAVLAEPRRRTSPAASTDRTRGRSSRSRSTSGPGSGLDREGLDDAAAAELMARLAQCV